MYSKSLRLTFLSLPVLAVLRCVVKILFIDTETGFTNGAPLLPWTFAVLLCAVLVLSSVLIIMVQDRGITQLHGNRALEIAGVLCAIGIAFVGAAGLITLGQSGTSVNLLPVWLRGVCYMLTVAAAAVMLWLSVVVLSGSDRSEKAAMLSLVLPVWLALYLVNRFVSFRQVTTVSDNLLETLFYLSALLFMLAHSRCLAGAVSNRRRMMLFAALSCILGVPLAAGQLIATAVLGECTGPSGSVCCMILVLSLYEACFALAAAASPQALPAEPDEHAKN